MYVFAYFWCGSLKYTYYILILICNARTPLNAEELKIYVVESRFHGFSRSQYFARFSRVIMHWFNHIQSTIWLFMLSCVKHGGSYLVASVFSYSFNIKIAYFSSDFLESLCSISLPIGSIRKPLNFWSFRGV